MTIVAKVDHALRYRGLVWAFAQRELKARYKDTALGWIWALFVPLATLGVYSVAFGVILRSPAPQMGSGRAPIFVVWLFCGFVVFNFFSNGVQRGIDGMINSAALFKKSYLPKYAPVLGALVAATFQSLVEATLLLCILAALGNVGWTWLLLPFWIALMFLFVAGMAVTFAVTAAFIRDTVLLTMVLMQMLFFATPVMYQMSIIPDYFHGIPLRYLLGLNPIARFVEMFRDLVYHLSPGTVEGWIRLVIFATISIAAGALAVNYFGRDLAERI